jgi:hypothetical protein
MVRHVRLAREVLDLLWLVVFQHLEVGLFEARDQRSVLSANGTDHVYEVDIDLDDIVARERVIVCFGGVRLGRLIRFRLARLLLRDRCDRAKGYHARRQNTAQHHT